MAFRFPLRFALPYTYPEGYDGQQAPCTHLCPQCDRTEGLWRNDPANTVNLQVVSDATAVVGAAFPWGSGTIVFPNAVVSAAAKLAFIQTLQPRATANAVG